MLHKSIERIIEAGGKPYYVGGYVRDKILGLESKDIDIEVYGLSPAQLTEVLKDEEGFDVFGQQFGIFKTKYAEFSIPRRDNKVGIGHTGFECNFDPNMSFHEATRRRDFTINAIMMDPFTGEIIDPHNGRDDIEERILRPVDVDTFVEDPLRILRGFQFATRFGMRPSTSLISCGVPCTRSYDEISYERVWGEWEKWALKGRDYSGGLRYLLRVIPTIHPEITCLITVPQNPIHHPEGDVLTHTGFVLDYSSEYCYTNSIPNEERVVLMFAALCHDFGKATTTEIHPDGRITAHGHEEASINIARRFLMAINCPQKFVRQILPLVEHHMIPDARLKIVRGLANKLHPFTNLRMLCMLVEADKSGRPPFPAGKQQICVDVEKAAKQENCWLQRQKPIVNGDQIIKLGHSGPTVGKLLDILYGMQIRGTLNAGSDIAKIVRGIAVS